jgi:hypothetical protein
MRVKGHHDTSTWTTASHTGGHFAVHSTDLYLQDVTNKQTVKGASSALIYMKTEKSHLQFGIRSMRSYVDYEKTSGFFVGISSQYMIINMRAQSLCAGGLLLRDADLGIQDLLEATRGCERICTLSSKQNCSIQSKHSHLTMCWVKLLLE